LTPGYAYDKYNYVEQEIREIEIVQRLENHPEWFSDEALEMIVKVTQHSEARGKVQRIHYLACLIADERNHSPTK